MANLDGWELILTIDSDLSYVWQMKWLIMILPCGLSLSTYGAWVLKEYPQISIPRGSGESIASKVKHYFCCILMLITICGLTWAQWCGDLEFSCLIILQSDMNNRRFYWGPLCKIQSEAVFPLIVITHIFPTCKILLLYSLKYTSMSLIQIQALAKSPGVNFDPP